MQAPRLDDVIRRVVAWHNRHPLARRIRAAQVHSVGEVVLPFACAQAPADARATPVPAMAAAPPQPSAASLAAVVLARAAARPVPPPWARAPAGGSGLDEPIEPIDPADVDLSLLDTAPEPDRPPDPAAAAEAAQRPADPSGARRPADPARPAGWLNRLRAALVRRGGRLPPIDAVFGHDFLWPSSPRQVARWARRHGRLLPQAPPDWPRRQVAPDAACLGRLRRKGLAHRVDLHLLTAAIGVGDRRLRLLVGDGGQVLGVRAYSTARIAVAALAASAAMLIALGTAATWHMPGGGADLQAAAAPATAAVAALPAPAGETAAADRATAPATPPLTAEPTAAPASAAAGDIRPPLSDETRRAARAESERLRGQTAAAAAADPSAAAAEPVYAVVTRASRQREAAARDLVLLQAVGNHLPPPAPGRAELMRTGSEWRAAWWPFASLVDAERARVMLAGRGLKAEVVEF